MAPEYVSWWLDFSSIPLWVQIHGLPIEYMSKENVEEISALVGEVLEVDFIGSGGVCMSKFFKGEGWAKGGGSSAEWFFSGQKHTTEFVDSV